MDNRVKDLAELIAYIAIIGMICYIAIVLLTNTGCSRHCVYITVSNDFSPAGGNQKAHFEEATGSPCSADTNRNEITWGCCDVK
jgi:hypothetical protein